MQGDNQYLIYSSVCISLYPYVGSRFSDRAHYNEFVENWFKSWDLMRRRLVSRVKNTQNRTAQRPKEKGHLARGWELPTPLASQEPPSFLWAFLLSFPLDDLCCYISLSSVHPPPTLVSHPCPTWVHVPSTTLSSALWAVVAPIVLSRGHIHINGVKVVTVGI